MQSSAEPASDPKASFPDDLPALTSIRFLLALGVVLFHYSLMWVYGAPHGELEHARLGVDAFFILSGFILTHVYRGRIETGAYRHRAFLVTRFARIYPMHAAMLAFTLAMVVAATLIGADYDHKTLSPLGFVEAALMVQAWFPADVQNWWNGPAWSLSAEWFAYLLFPAYAWIGFKLRDRPLVLVAMAAAAFLALDAVYRAAFGEVLPQAEESMGVLRIVPEFLFGVALYRLGEKIAPSRRLVIGSTLLAAVILGLLMRFEADDRLIVAATGPLLLGLALLSRVGADRIFAHPWMLVAGEASYALYLVHMPLVIAWRGVTAELTGGESGYRMAWPELAALLALTLVLALGLHLLWENPARRWIRRSAERMTPRAPDAGVAGSERRATD